jgi:hypothetical protein
MARPRFAQCTSAPRHVFFKVRERVRGSEQRRDESYIDSFKAAFRKYQKRDWIPMGQRVGVPWALVCVVGTCSREGVLGRQSLLGSNQSALSCCPPDSRMGANQKAWF